MQEESELRLLTVMHCLGMADMPESRKAALLEVANYSRHLAEVQKQYGNSNSNINWSTELCTAALHLAEVAGPNSML